MSGFMSLSRYLVVVVRFGKDKCVSYFGVAIVRAIWKDIHAEDTVCLVAT